MTRSRDELAAFQRSLLRIDSTLARMEKLFIDGRIKRTDLDSVYEALFLRAVTSFEAFLEALFLAILQGQKRYPSRRAVSSRMTTTSQGDLMDILLQGDKYMSWLPFRNTEERAKLYLREGRPFSELAPGHRSTLTTITSIRNAIAHKSPHAISEFKRVAIGSMLLLPREKNPAGFLRSVVRTGPSSRFEIYMGELGQMANSLS